MSYTQQSTVMSKQPGKKYFHEISLGVPRHHRDYSGKASYPSRLQTTPEVTATNFDEDDVEATDNYDSQREEDETIIGGLRKVIRKQAEMIQKLDHEILHLREKAQKNDSSRNDTTEHEDILAYINCKLDLLTEQVLYIAQKVSHDRRCRGYCVKHVRTKKCLCRGFDAAHRCCGRIGSICDC